MAPINHKTKSTAKVTDREVRKYREEKADQHLLNRFANVLQGRINKNSSSAPSAPRGSSSAIRTSATVQRHQAIVWSYSAASSFPAATQDDQPPAQQAKSKTFRPLPAVPKISYSSPVQYQDPYPTATQLEQPMRHKASRDAELEAMYLEIQHETRRRREWTKQNVFNQVAEEASEVASNVAAAAGAEPSAELEHGSQLPAESVAGPTQDEAHVIESHPAEPAIAHEAELVQAQEVPQAEQQVEEPQVGAKNEEEVTHYQPPPKSYTLKVKTFQRVKKVIIVSSSLPSTFPAGSRQVFQRVLYSNGTNEWGKVQVIGNGAVEAEGLAALPEDRKRKRPIQPTADEAEPRKLRLTKKARDQWAKGEDDALSRALAAESQVRYLMAKLREMVEIHEVDSNEVAAGEAESGEIDSAEVEPTQVDFNEVDSVEAEANEGDQDAAESNEVEEVASSEAESSKVDSAEAEPDEEVHEEEVDEEVDEGEEEEAKEQGREEEEETIVFYDNPQGDAPVRQHQRPGDIRDIEGAINRFTGKCNDCGKWMMHLPHLCYNRYPEVANEGRWAGRQAGIHMNTEDHNEDAAGYEDMPLGLRREKVPPELRHAPMLTRKRDTHVQREPRTSIDYDPTIEKMIWDPFLEIWAYGKDACSAAAPTVQATQSVNAPTGPRNQNGSGYYAAPMQAPESSRAAARRGQKALAATTRSEASTQASQNDIESDEGRMGVSETNAAPAIASTGYDGPPLDPIEALDRELQALKKAAQSNKIAPNVHHQGSLGRGNAMGNISSGRFEDEQMSGMQPRVKSKRNNRGEHAAPPQDVQMRDPLPASVPTGPRDRSNKRRHHQPVPESPSAPLRGPTQRFPGPAPVAEDHEGDINMADEFAAPTRPARGQNQRFQNRARGPGDKDGDIKMADEPTARNERPRRPNTRVQGQSGAADRHGDISMIDTSSIPTGRRKRRRRTSVDEVDEGKSLF
ncbi:hypothetical protein BST61_g3994 [Cercospora zeina]